MLVTAPSFLSNLFKHALHQSLSVPEDRGKQIKAHLLNATMLTHTYHLYTIIHRAMAHTRRDIFQDAVSFLLRAVLVCVTVHVDLFFFCPHATRSPFSCNFERQSQDKFVAKQRSFSQAVPLFG